MADNQFYRIPKDNRVLEDYTTAEIDNSHPYPPAAESSRAVGARFDRKRVGFKAHVVTIIISSILITYKLWPADNGGSAQIPKELFGQSTKFGEDR